MSEPIWQQIKKISDDVPAEEWDRVPANLATGESQPTPPDPIEEAVARALREVDWGADDFPSAWSRDYWTQMARAAIAAHLAALEKHTHCIVPDGLDPDELRRILTNGR